MTAPISNASSGESALPATAKSCVLTATGRSAIAAIGIQGKGATEAVFARFRPAYGTLPLVQQRLRYGHWYRSKDQSTGESVVIVRTGEEDYELHCHGGRAATQSILDDFAESGIATVSAAAWLQEHSNCVLAAECQLELTKTQTARTASIALDQCRGVLKAAAESIRQSISGGDLDHIRHSIQLLVDRYEIGRHLTQSFRVVIAGPPNVGKSSLINALLGYQRAITCAEPGTTRDVVSANTSIDGWMIELSDTAGVRDTRDVIEREGVDRAVRQVESADLVLIVVDATVGWTTAHDVISCRADRSLCIWNKIDLANAMLPHNADAISTSVLHPDSVERLSRKIASELVPIAPVPGTPIPVTARQHECLLAALDARDALSMSSAIERLLVGPM